MNENWREEIQKRLSEAGLGMKEVSLAAGRSETYVRDILKRDRVPSAENLESVHRAIDQLTGRIHITVQPNASTADTPPPFRDAMKRDIPVVATVAASEPGRGSFSFTMDPIDHVARPPGLVGVKGVFALYVENESMFPKYDAGELVYASDYRPAKIGDVVAIQDTSEADYERTGFIKYLERRTPEYVEVRQLNPAKTFRFKNTPSLRICRVYTNNELFGI